MIEIILISASIVVIYFLPLILAKDKPNILKVSLINILFGWTVIGWWVAFVMAKKTFEVKRGRGRPKGSTKVMKSLENIGEKADKPDKTKKPKKPKSKRKEKKKKISSP